MKNGLRKRVLPLLLSMVMGLSLLAGCTSNPPAPEDQSTPNDQTDITAPETPEDEPVDEPEDETPDTDQVTLHVAGLKGPTGMGMAKLMEDAANGETGNTYEFTLESAPDAIVGKIVSGELDLAAVPVNLAATLNKKTEGNVQLAAVNTLGVLYLLTNGETVNTVEDLRGKTIYATGQGSTPEYVLNYILSQNGLTVGEDVTVEYLEEHAALASSFLAGECAVAMLPEPFVTQVMTKSESAVLALNLTEEWEKTAGDTVLAMGGILVRRDFAEANKEAVDLFLQEYQKSVEYITDTANVEDAAALIEKFDIMPAAVAKNALPRCNIVFLDGEEMKESAKGFLQVVFEAEPKAVGGQLPDDDFYYAS